MTNKDVLQTALAQSAVDLSCHPADLCKGENVMVHSVAHPDARKYLTLPFACNLVSYGSNIVASVSPALHDLVADYIGRYPVEHCFETPHLHVLNDGLQKKGFRVCFMAEYFLPDLTLLGPLDCAYRLQILEPPAFSTLYLPQWSNALCEKRKHLDRLAVAAYDGTRLIGLAGASADCHTMWQIGIDVLPAYRRQGVAAALTSRLALEILRRGKVPFYCAAWSNIGSVRNALTCGFRPAWVELTAKPAGEVDGMNRP